ncbi:MULTISPECIES: MerR family transcriptional regulator [unclassified Pseudofrankia]|uniref:MerR family transcriptional regulator n=1 Tax=unclassified Pseudofrankia TaxID=2994372 RepID=UPI0008DABFA3|nr:MULTISPECIES: MerR family transcriptional regulator [unclassified Pseudofrankia]MDT3440582.1 MerR family transcriptional regulator [Pseudofrankia sp. BMG5.37]OHV62147.1 transcriptional regulator [Pseudofrankia sp. BMG5.36]
MFEPDPVVSIGEFSRLTYLSVKTLRHYHDVGLLEPAAIDPSTGYRRYSLDQVPRAHLIRRLRDLDMPVPEVRAVLRAPDDVARDATIRSHLERMEAELARTRGVVASLRELLSSAPSAPLAVTFLDVPVQPVFAVRATVAALDAGGWYADARLLLDSALAHVDARAAGPHGATWAHEYFEDERGEVVAFVPVPRGAAPRARDVAAGVESIELAGGRFAVAEHLGGFDDFDRTYGALGSHVVRHAAGLPDAIREVYRVGPDGDDPSVARTDVYWPVRATA